MRTTIALLNLCVIFFAGPLYAHGVFLTVDGAGEKTITISAGHSFPESEARLGEGLVKEFHVIDPDGGRTNLTASAGENVLKASYICKKNGIHLATLRYKPNFVDEEPAQFAHAVFFCGDAQQLKNKFKTDGALQFDFKGKDSTLNFAVLFNGAGVAGRIELFYFNGKATESSLIQTDRNGNFSFVSKGKGLYMLSFAHKGINLSLTFEEQ